MVPNCALRGAVSVKGGSWLGAGGQGWSAVLDPEDPLRASRTRGHKRKIQ